jgi:Flp pilus assembly protein TadD
MKQQLFAAGLLLALPAVPVEAARSLAPSPLVQYVRARAADVFGDPVLAARNYAAVLSALPDDGVTSLRTYRHALAAGDEALALRAATALDAKGVLPPDGAVLLLATALKRKDWADARKRIDRIQKEQVFAFLTPVMDAWLMVAMRQGDPVARLDAPGTHALAATYTAEHRALLLITTGRIEEGVAATRALSSTPGGGLGPLRIYAAASLAKAGQADRARDLLTGDDPVLEAARARLASGKRLIPASMTANDGIAQLLVRVAIDINRERVTPLALALSRIAAFLSPGNATASLATGELLSAAGRPDAALAALRNIPPDDLFAHSARVARLRILIAKGDTQLALDEALKIASAPGAIARDWSRLGEIYADLDRGQDAAAAYDRALALAESAKAPTDELWRLWLMRGSVLEQGGEWPVARAALQQALTLAPDEAVVLNYLGYAKLERREDMAEAQKLIERASTLRPDDASITDSLGWAYYLRGDVPKAVEVLERAAASEPDEPAINEHLGDAYWSAGRRYEARYSWRAALLQADDADGQRIRDKLENGLTGRTVSP